MTVGTAEMTIARAADLLGGRSTFKRSLATALDAHEVILSGFPGNALVHLASNVALIQRPESFEKATGISLRTFQRRKKEATPKRLSQEQSGRAWKFAEIVGKATDILGSQEEAERFLERPAIGLDQRRPIDLLSTPAGVELVEDHLERIRYGVYA
ncbi:antitoxin Xre/MbcA/ParS toxin-binding domain-containing protein [Sphingomonas carotinifaciens]|uniref:type II RES/Xre toxin-antitoxin system antitoxin n=1 Tax=Sphingomonas carotinifaciens TaxID=1166323 RepID=UPI0039A2E6F0